MLSTTVQDHNDWENRIRPVCVAYNSSTQTTTGFSPFYLMFGRQPRLPIDLTYGSMPTKKQYVSEYVKTLNSSLEEAYQNVKHNVTGIQDRQKEQYDKTVRGDAYQVGDLVWLHNPVVPRSQSKKFHRSWIGPYRIIECVSTTNYRIQSLLTRKKVIVHFNRLKPCIPGTRFNMTHQSTCSPGYKFPNGKPFSNSPEVGHNLELCENEDPIPGSGVKRRYPTRTRIPPLRYSPSSV